MLVMPGGRVGRGRFGTMRPQVKNWLQVAQEMHYLPLEKASGCAGGFGTVAQLSGWSWEASAGADFHQAMAPVALPCRRRLCGGLGNPVALEHLLPLEKHLAGAGLPPGDPAGAGCAAAGSSSAGAALPMFAKSGPSLVFPISAGRSKM